ncbi:unnamed protein product [Prorocentrum cordatum]|uniref:Uncharacterized protein n=1 Tax=Prorocentrum cordatum TaxID=2364126 RepID=A0ABN9SF71_9DINO|nr:unnamed protein product [Polarella glacialis]
MAYSRLLTTKNTFLDCESPWTEPVELPRRPSSDPGASNGTSASTDQTESSVGSRAVGARDSSGASKEAAAFVTMTRTQRRAKQRKDSKAMKARAALRNSSSGASLNSEPDDLALGQAVAAVKLAAQDAKDGAQPRTQSTKISL